VKGVVFTRGIAECVHAVKVSIGEHPPGVAVDPLYLDPPFLDPMLDEGNVVVLEDLGLRKTPTSWRLFCHEEYILDFRLTVHLRKLHPSKGQAL
jgi:hypothetical protein